MGAAAARFGRRDADERLADLVLRAAAEERPRPPTLGRGRVHFVGVGGAGMSGIARILLARGVTVSGSDAKQSRELEALRALGADVHVGHRAEQVADADTVVVSTAIRDSNEEVVEAVARGLRVLRRAEALAAVMADRRGVAVAGTHGKTTTTSMLTVALQHAGADPSFAIGGNLNDSGVNAHNGSGELFVAEADESDGSFLLLSPYAGIVTNVEPDHLDHYGTAAAVEAAFAEFAGTIDPAGFLVTCADDPAPGGWLTAARDGLRVTTYGESAGADLRIENLRLDGHRPFEVVIVHHGRSAVRSSCRSPAATTSSTPRRPSLPVSSSGCPRRSSGRDWPASAGPGAGSS